MHRTTTIDGTDLMTLDRTPFLTFTPKDIEDRILGSLCSDNFPELFNDIEHSEVSVHDLDDSFLTADRIKKWENKLGWSVAFGRAGDRGVTVIVTENGRKIFSDIVVIEYSNTGRETWRGESDGGRAAFRPCVDQYGVGHKLAFEYGVKVDHYYCGSEHGRSIDCSTDDYYPVDKVDTSTSERKARISYGDTQCVFTTEQELEDAICTIVEQIAFDAMEALRNRDEKSILESMQDKIVKTEARQKACDDRVSEIETFVARVDDLARRSGWTRIESHREAQLTYHWQKQCGDIVLNLGFDHPRFERSDWTYREDAEIAMGQSRVGVQFAMNQPISRSTSKTHISLTDAELLFAGMLSQSVPAFAGIDPDDAGY